MPANKNALKRYQILDELLSDRHHYYTREMLTQKVNETLSRDASGYSYQENISPSVTKRAIEKDLADMKALFDKIEYDESFHYLEGQGRKKTICYADPTFSIFSKPLSNDEKKLLYEVFNTLGQFSGLDNFEWLGDLKEKLANKHAFGSDEFSASTPEHKVIISFSCNEDLEKRENLGWFFSAIANRKVVKFAYRKFNATEEKTIIAYPYMLKQYKDRWYLLATPTLDAELPYNPDFIANFPLERITSFEYFDEIPYVDCPRDINELYDEIVGVTYYWDKDVEDIVFAVNKKSVPFIETKALHPYQMKYPSVDQEKMHVIYPNLEEYEFFHFKLKENFELKSLFKSFGSDVIVLEPRHLREAMKADAERQLNLYNNI